MTRKEMKERIYGNNDVYTIDDVTVTAKSYNEAAEKAMTIRKFDKMRMEIQYAINAYNSAAHEHNRKHDFKDYVPIMLDYQTVKAYPIDYKDGGVYADYE